MQAVMAALVSLFWNGDEMTVPALAAQIQGQGTVSADNLNTFIQTAQNSSELRTFVGLPGMVVNLQGISQPNDGLGGDFYWNPFGTEPDDNLNFIQPLGTTTGEWVRYGVLTSAPGSTFFFFSFSGSVSAAGSTQSTATLLTKQVNIVTMVASGTGVILPSLNPNGTALTPGTIIKILNRGANILSLYPPLNAQIENLGTNNPSGISVNGDVEAVFSNSSQWWIA